MAGSSQATSTTPCAKTAVAPNAAGKAEGQASSATGTNTQEVRRR
ncbi:MAG: hypothetical protein V9G13_12915 [Marmoricola sp.]